MTISFFLHSYKDQKGYRKIYLSYSHMTSSLVRPYCECVRDQYGQALKCKESEWIDLKTFAKGPKKGNFTSKDRPYRVRLSSPYAIERNRVLDQVEERILREIIPKLHMKGQAPTINNVANALKRGDSKVSGVEDMLAEFLEHRKRMGRAKSTILNTQSAIAFLGRYGYDNLRTFDHTLYEDIREFALYDGLGENSFRAYTAILKQFLKYAFKNDYIDPFPLEGWSTTTQRTEQAALRVGDIETLYTGKLEGLKDLAREYLLIFCMTGLRYSEFMSYSPQTIDVNKKVIAVKKGKLPNGQQLTHRVKLNPVAWEILSNYNMDIPRPDIVNRPHQFNPVIKEACRDLGINYNVVLNGEPHPIHEKVSTHTGRRTLVSTACTDFNFEYGKVRTITGHKARGDTVQIYNQRKNEEIGFMTMDLYYKSLRSSLSRLPIY